METRRSRAPGTGAAIAAGVIALLDVGLYLALIIGEGESETGHVAVVAVIIAVLGALALAGGLGTWPAKTRLIALGSATGGLFAAGVLGIFSIGLPLLVAGVCGVIAWSRLASWAHPLPEGTSTLSAVAALVTAGAVAALILAG